MWTYQNQLIKTKDELPNSEALFGFVYRIDNLTNDMSYIGRKNFNTVRKKKLTKKEMPTDKRLKTFKKVTKEGAWLTYWGSNKPLLDQVALHGRHLFTREIIALAYTAKQLTILETEALFNHNILRDKNFYNDNILGKFFRRDLIKNT